VTVTSGLRVCPPLRHTISSFVLSSCSYILVRPRRVLAVEQGQSQEEGIRSGSAPGGTGRR
jgi:hypothetical protein